MLTVRKPIDLTSPRKPSIVIISPIPNSPSRIMKSPVIISSISDCAPNPTIMPRTPAETRIPVVFTPRHPHAIINPRI